MRLHEPLNRILNNEIKIKLLRFLCRTSIEGTGRRLAREIQVSPAACHKALFELEREKILRLRRIGKAHSYSLDQNNLIVKNLLQPLYKKEEALPLALANFVRKLPVSLRKKVISLAIFGSVYRKEEKPYSDIDILIIIKEKSDKEPLEDKLSQVNDQIMRKFSNALSPYIQTKKEFITKFRKKVPVVRNIVRDHQLIFGKPLSSILYGR